MTSAFPVTGAVLVGGRSSRMGQDKARIELAGRSLAGRLAGLLAAACVEVLVVGDGAPELPGCRSVPDAHPARSSLTGLYSALVAAASPVVLVLACDYPLVGRRLLDDVLLRAWRPGLGSLVPHDPEGGHPLLALHARDLAPRLLAALDAGRYKIRAALDPGRSAHLPWASLRRLGVPPETFWNCNTPEELERARRFLEEQHGHAHQDRRSDHQ